MTPQPNRAGSRTIVRSSRRPVLKWLAAISSVLAASTLILLALQVKSPRDLVLLRNAVITDLGPPGAYGWTPASVPSDYRRETLPAPEPVNRFAAEVASRHAQASDLDLAIALAAALVRNRTPGRGPIQSNTLTALQRITIDGAGYCADYTQVFNAIGPAANLYVREWGMSFDGYGGDGHAFSEVWDRGRSKWVLIDTFYSFYVRDSQGEPLSATEFRAALLDGTAVNLEIVPIVPGKFAFKDAAKAIAYYERGAPRFYMVWGNDVITYDESAVVRFFSRFSRSAEQVAGIATGKQPRLLIPGDFADQAALQQLTLLRLLIGLLALSAAVALFSLTMVWWGRK